jgi:hypothetical protein
MDEGFAEFETDAVVPKIQFQKNMSNKLTFCAFS